LDYDLHGIAAIRLVDPSAANVAAVTRLLGGALRGPLDRDPDITIRFVDRIRLGSPLRYVGLNDVAFTDDSFFVLRSRGDAVAKVRIPFEQLGETCEIVCERSAGEVPLLVSIVNLTMLGKGFVPLHACAFVYNGTGIVVTGWPRGGKTSALLAFMAAGAEHVADDWVYLDRHGTRMFGLPTPVTLREAHLDAFPQYRSRVPTRERLLLGGLGSFGSSLRFVRRLGLNDRKTLAKLARLADERRSLEIPPTDLFGPGLCSFSGMPNKVFLTVGHELPDVTVERVSAGPIADRVALVLQHERLQLFAYYLKARFALREAENRLIADAEEIERAALAGALAGKDTYVLYHPMPAPAAGLFEAIRSVLGTVERP
jgi:hypothetical protein